MDTHRKQTSMSPFRNMQWSFKNVVRISSHLCYTCVSLRADPYRAAPHADTADHGEGVSTGHAGGASVRAQHRACHVSLPGPAHQDTFPVSGTTSPAAQEQPATWIQPQLHPSSAGGYSSRAGLWFCWLPLTDSHSQWRHLFVFFCQFSGQAADDMQKTYAEFCSRHLKAVKLYKELLAKDKKFQFFIRVGDTCMDICIC